MVKNANVLNPRSVPVGKCPWLWTAETTLSATPATTHRAVTPNHTRAHFAGIRRSYRPVPSQLVRRVTLSGTLMPSRSPGPARGRRRT